MYAQFWCHWPSTASLNCYIIAYYPKVLRDTQGYILKVDLMSFRRRPAPSKVSLSEKLSIIFGVFWGRFWTKLSFPAKRSTLVHSTSYIFSKLQIWRFILAIRKHFLSILRGVIFLLTQWDAYVNSILHCVIKRLSSEWHCFWMLVKREEKHFQIYPSDISFQPRKFYLLSLFSQIPSAV